ncbi:YaaC family protein [Defluviimonas denitrificans]|uniref:YaaC family protein n=1 Tax=Albidovulum denitrificans TaxID=404881 RepID=UPI0011B037EA
MDKETWARLSRLESQDAVGRAYQILHGRNLNAARAKQIMASARQAREYFRNANSADVSVRPLLAFYGVSGLARACVLLLGKHSGEASLTPGHGLRTIEWRQALSSNLSDGLTSLAGLRVLSCRGLFSDLVFHTNNLVCCHVSSGAVDWHVELPHALAAQREGRL